MNFDQYGLIVQDPPSNDGGDTCNRMGQYYTALAAQNPAPWPFSSRQECLLTYLNLTDDHGFLRRHKDQPPWNNPWNCSRDQMLPMFTALAVHGLKADLLEQFKNLLCRFGFYQNFQRDSYGTYKYPWPHRFKNDRGTVEFRWFDFADPSQPGDYAVFLRGFFHDSVLRFLAYPFVVLCDLWTFIGVRSHLDAHELREPCHILCFYVQSKKQIPTFVSRYLGKVLEKRKLFLETELRHYFGGRGGHDSPKFVELWMGVFK